MKCPRNCPKINVGRVITDTGIGYYYCKECGAKFGQYNFIDPVPMLQLIKAAKHKLNKSISDNQPYAGREPSCVLLRLIDQEDILACVEAYLEGDDTYLKQLGVEE